MKDNGKRMVLFMAALLVLFAAKSSARAKETEEAEEALWSVEEAFLSELDMDRLDENLLSYQEETGLSFSGTVKKLIRGEMPVSLAAFQELAREALFGEVERQKNTVISLLVLMIGASVFTGFAGIFEKSQVADVSFYVMYLLLFSVLMKAFYEMSRLTEEALEQLLSFMKLLMPAYLLASVFSSKSLGGTAFYELILGTMALVQWAMRYLVLPAVNLYFLFTILNHISGEEYLSKMAELLKTGVEWLMKTLMASVIGLQAIQNLILPAVDNLKNTIFQKSGGSLPVIGGIFNNVTEVVLGASVLIRNGLGAAGLLVLVFLCLSPMVKLLVTGCLYRVLAACTQPVADKRLMECLDGCGQGIFLLLKVLGTTGVLFFLSMALSLA